MAGNGCNCLCSIVHPANTGICIGEATYNVPFKDRMMGEITHVSMCGPCREAALDTSSFSAVAGQTVTVQRPPDDYVVIADSHANHFVMAKSALRDMEAAGKVVVARLEQFEQKDE
jgi:hypothetical protein